ncbi:MAG: SDR family oxidoreductase [Candidatus Omnitrophota bacterium]|nr:MAG: SDR family oxidoreductase [Candidatus Omnitrophota bacterium]
MYLVTGGAGFIGSNIVEALLEKGERVRVIDNFFSGKRRNVASFLDKIELIEGDIRDLPLLKKATEGVDYILHQAALRSVPKSLGDPLVYNEVNVAGTLNVLLAAKEAGVKRVVFASSSSIYGDVEVFPENEMQFPFPISPYAASKLGGELYCGVFSKVYNLETVVLRYFNVFGPRQDLESKYAVVVPRFIISMLKNEAPPVHGDGEQSRDFTYVDNVVEANILASRAPGVSGEIFNVACGRDYAVLDVVKHLNKIMGTDLEAKFMPPRAADIRRTLADISKAQKLLKFEVKVNFAEGLKKSVDWFKGHKDEYTDT